ncbi:MAG TPA: ester cyclase [Actinomycetota bacterium]|nr:ester cyclase [Actinomycetota bacterium]
MDTTSEPRDIAEGFLAAANAHDIEAMVSFWEPGAVETFPTFGETYRVPDGFASNFESLFKAVPDVSWEIVSVTADADQAVVRSKMSGTHLGTYQGIVGTGRHFTVETIDFLQIKDGKIVHNDVLLDGLEILRQLGVLPPARSRRERAIQKSFNTMTAATAKRMIEGVATATIARPPKDVLEFVLDLKRYSEADHKFHRIHYVKRHNDHGEAKYSGRLRGIPTPTEVQEWMLEPYTRLEFKSRPSLWPGIIARFEGSFDCEETHDGTLVRHREAFEFKPPFSWLAIPFLRSWLQRDVEDEVVRLKNLLESG